MSNTQGQSGNPEIVALIITIKNNNVINLIILLNL